VSDNDEKILKALEDLQAGQKALQADVKGLHGKVDTVELKVEAIHAYQKQAHDEIMDKLFESNEITGHAQQKLEKRVERIEKHLGLPPFK
jgi:uncharacterized protein YlxW (UPF0749 family)